MSTAAVSNRAKNGPAGFLLTYAFYFVFAAVFVFFSLTTGKFLTVSNLATLLLQASPYAIVTTGLSFVIISRDFDLSVGSVAFVSASVGIIFMKKGYPITVGIVLILLSGALMGYLNGFIITRLKVPAFIATLGMLIMGRGLGYKLVADKGGFTIPEALAVFPMLRVGPFYYEVIIMIVIMVIGQVALSRTAFGKTVFAVGNNEKAASYMGVNVNGLKSILFTLSGFMSSIAGLIYVSQSGYLHAALAQGWEFTAISMAVLGGVSLFGGEGTLVPGALVGVVLVLMIDNGLNIMGVSPYLYPFIKGLIIFIAIFADSIKTYRRR